MSLEPKPKPAAPTAIARASFVHEIDLGTNRDTKSWRADFEADKKWSPTETPLGLRFEHASGETVLVPWSNVRCLSRKPVTT